MRTQPATARAKLIRRPKNLQPIMCALACAWLTAVLPVSNLSAQQPIPDSPREVDPVGGSNVDLPVFLPGIDGPAAAPNHPPLDEIPWLKIPAPSNQVILNKDDTVTSHNAETGETSVLPSDKPSGLEFGQSQEQEYRGAFGSMVPEPQLGRSFSDMTVANNLETWPSRGNVKLVLHWVDINGNDVWSQCSGSMQDSGVVLAAAHCVFNREPHINDWCTEVYIYPAWDGTGTLNAPAGSSELIRNFGYVRSTFYTAGSGYINSGDFDRDVAALRINRGSSRSIGMLTGWFGWTWGGACDTNRAYHNFSYPAENCHNGRTMYYWFGRFDSCFGNQLELNSTGGNCLDTVWGGMSGSGTYWIENDIRRVHGVCSNSNRDDVGRYCKLWEQFADNLVDFESDTRGTTFDLEALRCRAQGTTTIESGATMDDQLQVYIANATDANPGIDQYTIRVYLSTNNNISEFDTLLATWNYDVDFAAMQGSVFNIPAPTIPSSTPAGTYWIGIEIDQATDTIPLNNDTDRWDAQQIEIVLPPPPANDDWTGGIQLPQGFPTADFGNNINATVQANEQDVVPAGSSVWWWFQATDTGTVTVDTFGSDFDTMLHVYTDFGNGFGNFTKVGEDDNSAGTSQSRVSFDVQAGKFYEIRVSGFLSDEGQIALFAQFDATPVDLVPESVVLTAGVVTDGGVAEIQTSDNADYSVARNQNSLQPTIRYNVTSTSPVFNPSSIEFGIEESVFARGNVARTIEMFDYTAGTWIEVDSRTASRNVDRVDTITLTGPVAQYVQPGTGLVETRVSYRGAVARAVFRANVDHLFWSIGN